MKKRIIFLLILIGIESLGYAQKNGSAEQLEKEKALQRILDKTVDNKKVFGCSFAVKKNGFSWVGSSGNMSLNQSYFIASTTKLFTTALIMQLRSEGKLKLDDFIVNYLPDSITQRLNVFLNKDYSNTITIQHLLSHSSGLPDYFQDKGKQGFSLEQELLLGRDQAWTPEQAIERTKNMRSFFRPSSGSMAHYSDANFQLLGLIIEKITGKPYAEACLERIMQPLALTHTYVYQDEKDTLPKALYYKTKELYIPKAMTSFGADGGIVSTSEDMMVFIQAFFQGKLFPATYISEMQKWRKIFFPMRSGIGFYKFELPWLLNPMGAVPVFIGHSGLSGALAYYCPEEDVFVVGTVNQIANPDLSFKTMIKLTREVSK